MKNFISTALILTTLLGYQPKPVQGQSSAEPALTHPDMEWFKDAKFGMFIHWGPYSLFAGEWNGRQVPVGENAEWIMQKLQIPVEKYRKVAATFYPVKFDANEWVALAKNAGMKYLVVTAKHHDGFAMYHSRASDYNIVEHTPFKRDPLKELSEACRKAGIKFCLYYSHREDWDHPYAYGNFWDYDSSQTNLNSMDHPRLFRNYLDEKAIPQLKELLTGYGPIGLVWFDRGMYTQEQGREFVDLVHSTQPACLVNGRVGHYDKELLGDYQNLSDNGMPVGGIEEYWESPQTLNETWGYSKFDNRWKPAEEIIRRLVIIVSKDGNYLLNVGPTGEGIIPQPSVDILKTVGKWMQNNSESIHGTSPSPFPQELGWGYSTVKDNKIYLHVFDWPGNSVLGMAGLNNRIDKAYLLADKNEDLVIRRHGKNNLSIQLPDSPPDGINSVVVLEIEGKPDVDPAVVEQEVDRSVILDYLTAVTTGQAAKRFNRKGGFHVSGMESPADAVKWHVNITRTGTYDVFITFATSPEWGTSSYVLNTESEDLRGNVEAAGGWFDYRRQRIGQLNFGDPGERVIQIHSAEYLQHPMMYLKSIEMVPSEQ